MPVKLCANIRRCCYLPHAKRTRARAPSGGAGVLILFQSHRNKPGPHHRPPVRRCKVCLTNNMAQASRLCMKNIIQIFLHILVNFHSIQPTFPEPLVRLVWSPTVNQTQPLSVPLILVEETIGEREFQVHNPRGKTWCGLTAGHSGELLAGLKGQGR